MKIGIFGDSFAANNPYLHAKIIGEEEAAKRKSWVDHIEIEKGIRVGNHAKPGSGLYFSYSEFKKYQRTYDKIIFVVTDWGRLWVPNISIGSAHIPGITNCEVNMNHCKDEDDLIIYKAAHDYYIYLQNMQEQIDLHKLMVNEILRIRSDALLIPSFDNDTRCFIPEWKGYCLEDIDTIDNSFYKIKRRGIDLKHCHMNNDNNLIFAKQVIEWIDRQTPIKIDLKDYVAPKEPVEYYYDPSHL